MCSEAKDKGMIRSFVNGCASGLGFGCGCGCLAVIVSLLVVMLLSMLVGGCSSHV